MNEINEILDTIQARCDGATKGPWRALEWGDDERMTVESGVGRIAYMNYDECESREKCRENADFTAQARTDEPNLIAALREAVVALEGLHEYWNRDPNENAMHNACENTIEVADRTLATIAKLLKGEKP